MAPLSAPSRSAARAGIVKPTRGLGAVIMLALGLGGAWLATAAGTASTMEADELTRARERIAAVQGWRRPDRAEAREHARRHALRDGPAGERLHLMEPFWQGRRPFELGMRPFMPPPVEAFRPARLFPSDRAREAGPGSALLSTPAGERLGFGTGERPTDNTPEQLEWTRLRRQLAAALPNHAELVQASALGIAIRCVAHPDTLGGFAAPGLVQDAATAARVRSSLAADPRTRDLPRNVTCEAGSVRLSGPFRSVAELALAINAAAGVDGVREVRADLPDDMLVVQGTAR